MEDKVIGDNNVNFEYDLLKEIDTFLKVRSVVLCVSNMKLL